MKTQFLPRLFGQSNRRPNAGLIAIITGVLFLPFTPLQSKSTCKPETRYSIYYKQPAYVQGFNNGYDGVDYKSTYSTYEDKVLYDMGYEDGDTAYLEDKFRYNNRKMHH